MSDLKAGRGSKRKVLSCDACEIMILNLPSNLFKVLIVNRHNLAMSWEGPEDKVAVFQMVSVFFFFFIYFTLPCQQLV